MPVLTEIKIRERLSRVEALHRGATTPGEREAAARARERLVARLVEVRAQDEVARFCAAHVASLGVAPNRAEPADPLPTEREALTVLTRWESGEWSRERVHRWAARVCDRVHFPEGTHDEGARVAEVVLQLAALHHVDLRAGDVPRMRRFVRHGDWAAWFDLVAEAAAR